MRIKLALLNSDPGWEMLLAQEGVSYEVIDANSLLSKTTQFQMLIIHSNSAFGDPKVISDHIKNGGVILFEAESYARVFNRKFSRTGVKHLFPDPESTLNVQGVIDFHTDFAMVKGNSNNFLDKNLKIIWNEIGKGSIAVIPFQLSSVLLDTKWKRKRFPAGRTELPSELVARVSKGKIRKLIRTILIKMCDFRDVPYIQKWYLNSPDESCFLFRVDTDFCEEEDAEKLYNILKRKEINGTWFIDTASEYMLRNVYNSMPDQEIAFHCDRHRIFDDYEMNRFYINRGLDKLQKERLAVNGYAAPFGQWNPELGKVLEDLQFSYSSEFSLNYDDLPFFPAGKGKHSVLQIPIHPVSPGRLRRAHFTESEMVQYYKTVIDMKIAEQEPVIIYHHPSHQYFAVIEEILEYVNSLGLPNMTFRQFALWWKFRNRINLNTNLNGSTLSIDSDEVYDFHLKLTKGNQFAIIPFQKKIDLNDLNWQSNPEQPEIPVNRKIRNFYWRDLLNDYESYKGKMKK